MFRKVVLVHLVLSYCLLNCKRSTIFHFIDIGHLAYYNTYLTIFLLIYILHANTYRFYVPIYTKIY